MWNYAFSAHNVQSFITLVGRLGNSVERNGLMEKAPIRFAAEIADIPFEVRCFYSETEALLKNYRSEKIPEFVIDLADSECSGVRTMIEKSWDKQTDPFAVFRTTNREVYIEEETFHWMLDQKLSPFGVFHFHGSAICLDGEAYIFTAESGTGKSTHSQLWIKNIEGCSLLNDDNPILRVMENGEIRVFGSPWSGKTPCYKNDNVPVGAFVNLRQAKKNAIRRLSLPEAYAAMCMSFSGYRFIREMADGLHATNEKVVSTVPFYLLECLPDAEAAWLCHDTVSH